MSTLRDIVGSDEPTTVENMQADRPLVDLLYARGVIDKKAKRMAFNTLYPRIATRKLVLNSILGVAAAFFASGFIMIMAANWHDLGNLIRLLIPQVVMVLCLLGIWWKGISSLAGKLFACGVVLGIEGMLVILTQNYQLDADSAWFFRRLIFLPLPVIIVTRFLPLWAIWIVLFNFYLIAEISISEISFRGFIEEPELFFSVVSLITFIFLFEFVGQISKGNPSWDWIRSRWFRFLLVLYALYPTVAHITLSYGSIIDSGLDGVYLLDLILMVVGVLFVIGGIFYFSKLKTDLWSLALFVLGADILVLIIAMITFVEVGFPDEGLPVIGLILSVLIFWGSYVLLNKFRLSLRKNIPEEVKELESTQGMKASELIDALSDEFEIDEERAREVALERIQKNQMPIYLRTLIGIGSFVSAGFLILFVGVTLGIDESSIYGVGLFHVICAIPLYLYGRKIEQNTPFEAFLTFFSFALILSGKIMCVAGFSAAFDPDDVLGASLMVNIIFTCVTYPIYNLYMDRFISFTSCLVMALFWVMEQMSWPEEITPIAFFSLVAPLAFIMMIHPRVTRTFRPVSIGLLSTSIGLAVAIATMSPGIIQFVELLKNSQISIDDLMVIISAPIVMLVVSVYVMVWACGGKVGRKKRVLVVSILALFLLCSTLMTGPVLAISIIVLGYAQHDRIISLLGVLLLPVALFQITRRLDLGLMDTGLILVIKAGVLLIVYFCYNKWAFVSKQWEFKSPDDKQFQKQEV